MKQIGCLVCEATREVSKWTCGLGQGMKESACMELSIVAEEHWSDGALDVRTPLDMDKNTIVTIQL